MTGTVLLTALFGRYDKLAPVMDIPGVQCICFTDDPELKVEGWEVERWTAPVGWHPRMAAKWFKTHPRQATDADRTVWMDASHKVIRQSAVWKALDCVAKAGIALHRHPARQCIYQEANASLRFRKYDGQPIAEQVEAYRKEGHPEAWGLWACGTMATVRGPADALLSEWWEECLKWSYQDQISFPVVMRRNGVRPSDFPDHQYRSPWFRAGEHLRND